MKSRILIFGKGKSSKIVVKYLNTETCSVVGYLDNNWEEYADSEDKVYSPRELMTLEFDYIVLGTVSGAEAKEQLVSIGAKEDSVIPFFGYDEMLEPIYEKLFLAGWEIASVRKENEVRLERIKKDYMLRLRNIKYEILSHADNEDVWFPKILSSELAVEKIVNEGCSLCRFGDGEFETIFGNKRCVFQKNDDELGKRLLEVLQNRNSKVLVGLANNYGSLDTYTDDAANAIRQYLTEEIRNKHLSILSKYEEYYDAYLTRPYVIYKDKESAKNRFETIKCIWNNKDIVIVEGELTRMGIGNDLFSNVASIKRVIAPNRNAFDVYDKILASVCSFDKNRLILISLGPTATVLAYDLANLGYQAIDIGHIDVEYEWYLRGTENRTILKNKFVAELPGGMNVSSDFEDGEYFKQIVEIIK